MCLQSIDYFNFFDTCGFSDNIFHKLTENKEERLYKNKPNKYSVVVLTFTPLDKKSQVKSPKTYAFIKKSVDRIGKGFAPKEKVRNEEKILRSIENCVVKILKKTENNFPEKICESAFLDNIRYLFLEKYSYQKTVFGKDRNILELVLLITFLLIFTIILLVSLFF